MLFSRKSAMHFLRIGMGITFLWIGILIAQNPDAWGGYIQPWALKLMPLPINQLMFGTAMFDIGIGVLLLINIFSGLAGLLGALHLAAVLITTGINAITVRDIGLLGGAITIAIANWPRKNYM